MGSATGADAAPGAVAVAALAAGISMPMSPLTVTWPFMPASAWPGMEQMNARPSAGTVTLPVAVLPASAVRVVPSANVTSWSVRRCW